MAPLPSPPFVPIEGMHNFRSIGGYPTHNPPGSTVRQNFIYRSAEPSRITAAGIRALRARRITTIFDLRSEPEIEKMKAMTPVTEIEGVERVFVPVFRDRDYSPEAIALRCQDYTSENGTEGFRNAYADILERGAGAYRRILLHLRDSRPPEKEEGGEEEQEEGEACLLHCTAGKDRTGVMVALVLQLVGVEDQVIAEEYALTEMGLADWKETILEHLMKDVGMHGGREGVERMIGARPENMLASLASLKSKYGGAEGYMKQECGLDDEDIRKIRANLVEKAS